MKLKEANEMVGALKKEIRTYLDSDARKAIPDKENDPKLKELEGKFTAAQADLDAEIRQQAREGNPAPVLSDRERRDVDRFDIGKVLRSMVRSMKGAASGIDGIEAEMLAEGEKEARAADCGASGLMLPRMVVRRVDLRTERRDSTTLSATGGTDLQYGGSTIQTDKGGLYDAFFDASVLRKGGATVIEGLSGNLDLNKLTAGTVPVKKAEGVGAVQTSPTTSLLSLNPNRLPVFVQLSGRLLMQGPAAINAWIRRNVETQLNAVAEKAYFHGVGTDEPEGIFHTTGIGNVIGGTNGGAPDYDDIVDLETAVDVENANVGVLHYFTNGRVRGKLKKTVSASGTDSRRVWADVLAADANPLVTNAISHTLTKGSSGAVCSALGYGNIADYIMAFWGAMSIELLRDVANAKVDEYTLVLAIYHDGGVIRPVSFAAMLDALTT